MIAAASTLNPSMIEGIIKLVMQNPRVSAVIGGIGLGNLASHLPRFRQEKVQTIGIGALTAGYLVDSASHILLAGSSVGALGMVTVGLLTGCTALATYAGIEWASRRTERRVENDESKYATAAIAGIGTLHFASHAYMAARALLGSVYTSASLLGAGILGLAGNLGLVVIATHTLFAEFVTHEHSRSESIHATPGASNKRIPRTKRGRRGAANLFGFARINRKLRRTHVKAA